MRRTSNFWVGGWPYILGFLRNLRWLFCRNLVIFIDFLLILFSLFADSCLRANLVFLRLNFYTLLMILLLILFNLRFRMFQNIFHDILIRISHFFQLFVSHFSFLFNHIWWWFFTFHLLLLFFITTVLMILYIFTFILFWFLFDDFLLFFLKFLLVSNRLKVVFWLVVRGFRVGNLYFVDLDFLLWRSLAGDCLVWWWLSLVLLYVIALMHLALILFILLFLLLLAFSLLRLTVLAIPHRLFYQLYNHFIDLN